MIFHENHLLADNSHQISCLICCFWKSSKIWNGQLLQIVGDALRLNIVLLLQLYGETFVEPLKNLKISRVLTTFIFHWQYKIWQQRFTIQGYGPAHSGWSRVLLATPSYEIKLFHFNEYIYKSWGNKSKSNYLSNNWTPGGVLWNFYTYVGSGYFLGFKILNFNIFWGFQKNVYFLKGMKILWIFFWVTTKLAYIQG